MSLTDSKQTILHPLHCLYKLALIGCCDKGAKLSICNYIITIQENNWLQGLLRTKNADNRNDIEQLYLPIIKAMKWYVVEDDNEYLDDMDNDIRHNIKKIAKYSLEGIKRLQE